MTRARLYFPRLDGLRFLAFLLVLIHHSPYAARVPGWETLHRFGWMGVDRRVPLVRGRRRPEAAAGDEGRQEEIRAVVPHAGHRACQARIDRR